MGRLNIPTVQSCPGTAILLQSSTDFLELLNFFLHFLNLYLEVKSIRTELGKILKFHQYILEMNTLEKGLFKPYIRTALN